MDLAAVRARLLADRSLQFDYSVAPAEKPWRQPKWFEDLVRFLAHAIQGALPVLKVVFWIGVAAAILTVLFLVLREVSGARFVRARKARPIRAPQADWRPEALKARALLEDADRLADQGRFDAAARLILTRGIEDFDDRRPRVVRPGLTARDIAALSAMPPRAQGAFGEIAAAVEASWFGGRPLNAEAFARCRRAYEAFAFAEGWA